MSGKAPEVTPDDGLEAVAIRGAAEGSIRTGLPVILQDAIIVES